MTIRHPYEKTISPFKQELVEAVRKYAIEHYNEGGWDFLVEAWSDEQVADTIGLARSVEKAIAKCAESVGAVGAYRDDVIAAGGGADEYADDATAAVIIAAAENDPAMVELESGETVNELLARLTAETKESK